MNRGVWADDFFYLGLVRQRITPRPALPGFVLSKFTESVNFIALRNWQCARAQTTLPEAILQKRANSHESRAV